MQVKIELILNYLHLGFDALSDWLKNLFLSYKEWCLRHHKTNVKIVSICLRL